MSNDTNLRFPNLGKLSIAILENLVEPILGEKAIDEIRAPLVKRELKNSLAKALAITEKRFIREHNNDEIVHALQELPLANLPSSQKAIQSLYSQPNDPEFYQFLYGRLSSDFPSIPSDQIKAAVTDFVRILKEELVSVSGEIREKLLVLANLDIQQTLANIDQTLNHILDLAKKHESLGGNSSFSQVTKEARILIKKKSDTSWVYESTSPIITIGRSDDSNIILEEKTISWHHGFIERISGHYRYHHLSNTNPTIIRRYNEEYLLTKKRLKEFDLQTDDRIHIGNTILIIDNAFELKVSGYVTTEKENREQ